MQSITTNLFTMLSIEQFGWDSHFQNHFNIIRDTNLEAGRVLAIEGFNYQVITNHGMIRAQLSGSLINGRDNWELPKTGDWVTTRVYGDEGIIIDVLPRKTEISRKRPGEATEKQVIATNVDTAFIIQGLDRDFNIMKLQRYLQQVMQCGIKPVVILNKRDLSPDPEAQKQEVVDLGYTCPIVLTNALDRDALAAWGNAFLEPQKTYVLIGSSGVGKSTLLNSMLGYELQAEGEVSDYNGKGQHTTTTRNLVLLENGCMIIDTPGMREFGLTLDSGESAFVHPRIEDLAARCKFSDCTHHHEPGCSVLEALQSGELPQIVYQAYLKMIREQFHYQGNVHERKRMERQFGRMAKKVVEHRRKRKY